MLRNQLSHSTSHVQESHFAHGQAWFFPHESRGKELVEDRADGLAADPGVNSSQEKICVSVAEHDKNGTDHHERQRDSSHLFDAVAV